MPNRKCITGQYSETISFIIRSDMAKVCVRERARAVCRSRPKNLCDNFQRQCPIQREQMCARSFCDRVFRGAFAIVFELASACSAVLFCFYTSPLFTSLYSVVVLFSFGGFFFSCRLASLSACSACVFGYNFVTDFMYGPENVYVCIDFFDIHKTKKNRTAYTK